MNTVIGIKKDHREAVAILLKQLLADEFVLYTKYRNAHWNVEGIDFHSKHAFFEEGYRNLEKTIDQVAERIRMLGFYSPGSMQQFMELSGLRENGPEQNDSTGFMQVLLEDHRTIIKFLRKGIRENVEAHNDEGTIDFLTAVMQMHEQMAWMLRSSLKTFN